MHPAAQRPVALDPLAAAPFRGGGKHTNPETHKSETYPTRAEARGHTPRGHECYCLRSLFPPSPPPPHPTPPHKRKMFVCLNYRAKCLCAPEYQGGRIWARPGPERPLWGAPKGLRKNVCVPQLPSKKFVYKHFQSRIPFSKQRDHKKLFMFVCPTKISSAPAVQPKHPCPRWCWRTPPSGCVCRCATRLPPGL